MAKHEFTDETRDLLPKLMGWFWTTFHERKFMDFGLNLEDFDFMYALYKNGVWEYDDKMRDRLNKIRDIYIKMTKNK